MRAPLPNLPSAASVLRTPSTNSGFPAVARCNSATIPTAGAPVARPATRSPTSLSVSAAIGSTRASRTISSISAERSVERRISASRYVPMIRTLASCSTRATNCSICSDAASASCKSSRTMTSGCSRAASLSSVATASKSRKRACSGSMCALDSGASDDPSGRIRAISAERLRERTPGGPDSARTSRMTWIHGQWAGAPPPSQHRPHRTRIPFAVARLVASSASHVLPMPGSPVKSKSRPRSARAASIAERISASSRFRPTK